MKRIREWFGRRTSVDATFAVFFFIIVFVIGFMLWIWWDSARLTTDNRPACEVLCLQKDMAYYSNYVYDCVCESCEEVGYEDFAVCEEVEFTLSRGV